MDEITTSTNVQSDVTENPSGASNTETPNVQSESSDSQPIGKEASQTEEQGQNTNDTENYQFEIPEGFEINEALTAELTPILKENNVSKEAAQSLVNLHIKALQDAQKQANDAWYGQEKVWLETINKDPELGDVNNQQMALQAVKQFGTPELSKLLEDTRLGSHPEVVRLFIKIGKTVSEDSSVNGTTGNTRQLPRDETGRPMLSFKTM